MESGRHSRHNNRESAEQLYITRRTVETYLTHAHQKLTLTSRAELPATLHGTSLRSHATADPHGPSLALANPLTRPHIP